MKKGFTLLELLTVILIVGVVGASSIIVFGNIEDDTSAANKVTLYKDIQRAGVLYMDLNNKWLEQFQEKSEIYIKLGELKSTNYVTSELIDPTTDEIIPSSYSVKVFIAKDSKNNSYINTCVVSIGTGSGGKMECIADSNGEECECDGKCCPK